jgi:protein SCO1/2
MPAATLIDMNGHPYDLRRETAGKLTLILFGYTNCPDICPVHLANLSAVLREASDIPRERLQVLFITTDPERDTPERLREWMSHFDRSFVGLTGTPAELDRLQKMLNLPVAAKQPARAGVGYDVGHAAQVLAFTRDGRAHLAYPFGTRQAEWAEDLPRLMREDWGERSLPAGSMREAR